MKSSLRESLHLDKFALGSWTQVGLKTTVIVGAAVFGPEDNPLQATTSNVESATKD